MYKITKLAAKECYRQLTWIVDDFEYETSHFLKFIYKGKEIFLSTDNLIIEELE